MFSKRSTVYEQPEVASRLRGALPHALAADLDPVLQIIPVSELAPTTCDIGSIMLKGEVLRIPSRIYSPEPARGAMSGLSDSQRIILACLYTRHHDGHVREKYLLQLVTSGQAWVPAFVIQLLGEYVVEITLVVVKEIDRLRDDHCRRFAAENPGFMSLTRQRIISYWHCYSRAEFKYFRDYPAYQAMSALGYWDKNAGRRLLKH